MRRANNEKQRGVAILGCGNIADKYTDNLVAYPEPNVIGVMDTVRSRCRTLRFHVATSDGVGDEKKANDLTHGSYLRIIF